MKKVLISLTILTSMLCTTVFADVPFDVKGTPYESAVNVLSQLKIMVGDDVGTFRPYDTIRRSEFAAVAVRMAGIEHLATNNAKPNFPDVPADHWAVGHINLAVSKKYLIGDVEGTFRPDANLSIAEAATILLRVAGRENEALEKGGYPDGYLIVAQELGMLNYDARDKAKTPISRGDVANMAWNTLGL